MRVSDIISYSVNSDLRQTSLSDIGSDLSRTEEQSKNVDTLVSFLNQGIVEIYKRFPIAVTYEEVFLDGPTSIDDAIILPSNALYLIGVTDTAGEEVPLDNYNIELMYKRKSYVKYYLKTIAINKYIALGTFPPQGEVFNFSYSTAPSSYYYESNLDLPLMFQEPLLLYMAYKAFSTIQNVTPAGDTGNNYRQKYELSVKALLDETSGLFFHESIEKLHNRNFV